MISKFVAGSDDFLPSVSPATNALVPASKEQNASELQGGYLSRQQEELNKLNTNKSGTQLQDEVETKRILEIIARNMGTYDPTTQTENTSLVSSGRSETMKKILGELYYDQVFDLENKRDLKKIIVVAHLVSFCSHLRDWQYRAQDSPTKKLELFILFRQLLEEDPGVFMEWGMLTHDEIRFALYALNLEKLCTEFEDYLVPERWSLIKDVQQIEDILMLALKSKVLYLSAEPEFMANSGETARNITTRICSKRIYARAQQLWATSNLETRETVLHEYLSALACADNFNLAQGADQHNLGEIEFTSFLRILNEETLPAEAREAAFLDLLENNYVDMLLIEKEIGGYLKLMPVDQTSAEWRELVLTDRLANRLYRAEPLTNKVFSNLFDRKTIFLRTYAQYVFGYWVVDAVKLRADLLKNPTLLNNLDLSQTLFVDTAFSTAELLDIIDKGALVIQNIPVPETRHISAGEYTMGDKEMPDNPEHSVVLTKDFELGRYQVTQEEYTSVMGNNPSDFEGAEHPVENILWEEAVEYCRRLSLLSTEVDLATKKIIKGISCHAYIIYAVKHPGLYRLPTEAEWEYAAKEEGNLETKYPGGNDLKKVDAYSVQNRVNQKNQSTQPVGTKRPNRLGLYDMIGNVGEWCCDIFDGKLFEQGGKYKDPVNFEDFSSRSSRVTRGGGWNAASYSALRFSDRSIGDSEKRRNWIGLRIARTR